jgi:hypothetical protein
MNQKNKLTMLKYKNNILGMLLCLLPMSQVLGIDYKDSVNLEPYPLTQKLIKELTQVKTKNPFSLKGLSITTKQRRDSLSLFIECDPRLNLWRGLPTDLARPCSKRFF